VIKISFCPTNQNSVALYHIRDDASFKLTLSQPPTVVVNYVVNNAVMSDLRFAIMLATN
jgi:hypothetical protein